MKNFWQWTFFTVVGSIIGGFIAGFIGIWFSTINQRRQAKIAFLVTLSELKQDPLFTKNPKQFRAASLEQLRGAIGRVMPFLKTSSRSDLSKCWEYYQQVNPDNLDDSYAKAVVRSYCESLGMEVRTDPAKILPLFFKKFEDIVGR